MLTNKCILLSVFAIFLTLRVGAQNSLGDPVLYEDFGFGTNYTPVGPPLSDDYSTMKAGGSGRCPNPGRYLILNSSANCYDDTFSTINFDHSGASPFGYLMMVNGDSIPVVYYTRKISGSKFCPGARYQFAVFLSNINTQKPRPANYVDANIHFSVKTLGGVVLSDTYSTGPLANDSFTQYHVDFVAPADGSDVVISLSNNALTGSIGNDFAMDDITVKPYGPVIDAGIGLITGPDTTTQCLNDGAAKYVLKTFVHNYLTPQYQWQSNFNKKGWVNIPGQTKADLILDKEFLNPAAGKYEYRVGVLSAPGVSINCQTFSEPLTIDVVKNPSFTLPAITSVCEGEILSIHADGGTYFHWTLPDGSTSEEHFLDVTTSATKSNEGVYTVLITRDNCTFETKTQVIVGEPLVATVDDTNPVVCEGDAVQLGAHGGTIYKWTPSIGLDHDDVANPMASPTVTTEYNVVVSNGACEKQRTVTVKVIKKPKADAGKDKAIQEGDAVKLDGAIVAGNIANYHWTSSDNTSYFTSLTPVVSPTESTTYTLHLESSDNCGSASDEVFIRVFKKLTIPTTITPNNDGVNDIWNIDKLITYPESVLSVYTRNGHEVFRTVGDAKHWNGIYQGRQLPAGVYYYVIDLKNNLPKKAGWVMLVR